MPKYFLRSRELIRFTYNKLIKTMYKIKEKYKNYVAKYAWTKLDINGIYSLEEWKKNGFTERVLELIENK